MLVARWVDVCPYRDRRCTEVCGCVNGMLSVRSLFCTHTQQNNFQAVVVTNGLQSYTVFTYQCGELNWKLGYSSFRASIGYSVKYTSFVNHPFSQQANVTDIACLNQHCPPWTNVVYKISREPSNIIFAWTFKINSNFPLNITIILFLLLFFSKMARFFILYYMHFSFLANNIILLLQDSYVFPRMSSTSLDLLQFSPADLLSVWPVYSVMKDRRTAQCGSWMMVSLPYGATLPEWMIMVHLLLCSKQGHKDTNSPVNMEEVGSISFWNVSCTNSPVAYKALGI